MKTTAFAAATLFLALPCAALALPAMGDRLGTNADEVRAALDAAGCPAKRFEAEDGKIEAKCAETATGATWDLYIDPKTGVVTKITKGD